MKGRNVDIAIIGIITLLFVLVLISPEYLGETLGRMISGIFVISSFILSWKLTQGLGATVKIVVYFVHYIMLFFISTIVIDSMISVTAGTFGNIFILILISLLYYFFLYKKLIRK